MSVSNTIIPSEDPSKLTYKDLFHISFDNENGENVTKTIIHMGFTKKMYTNSVEAIEVNNDFSRFSIQKIKNLKDNELKKLGKKIVLLRKPCDTWIKSSCH